ncbi:MAG TPA: hypothetical protein VFD30_20450 [Terriglobia bacterium]|nr:hypothetical protein [Terriglobia bacterium]
MAKNKLSDLRDHLFETIEALKDPDKPMDVVRAKAISDVAQTIINSAKAEIDLLKVVEGNRGSEFFGDVADGTRARIAAPVHHQRVNGKEVC